MVGNKDIGHCNSSPLAMILLAIYENLHLFKFPLNSWVIVVVEDFTCYFNLIFIRLIHNNSFTALIT
jgi:hypothetical protein